MHCLRGANCRMIVVRHNSEVVVFSPRDLRALYANVPDPWRRYELAKLMDVPGTIGFPCVSEVYVNGSSVECKLGGSSCRSRLFGSGNSNVSTC